jgi:hypothetical protein
MAQVANNSKAYFAAYSVGSTLATIALVENAVSLHGNFFDVVVDLTSSKINLLVFLNFLLCILLNMYNLFVYLFFGTIRETESKVRPYLTITLLIVHN